ncbi:MAG: hypothetical protein WC901_02055 [Candidatus Margulisiibacteriota bacterium]
MKATRPSVEIFNTKQLPHRARHPEQLRLLRRGVQPTTLPLDEQIAQIREIGLPNLDDPLHFVDRVIKIERALGTVPAVLCTQVAACHHSRLTAAEKGLQLLETVRTAMPASLASAPEDILGLYCFASPALKFGDNTDLISGMETFLCNLSGSEHPVGNCQITGILFGLIGISLGISVEEERCYMTFDRMYVHSGVKLFSASQSWLYQTIHEAGNPTDASFVPAGQPDFSSSDHFSGSIYSFISSILINKVMFRTWGTKIHSLTRQEKHKLLKMLSVAERINPYNNQLYRLRSKIYASLGNQAAAQANQLWADAIGRLTTGPNGLPSVSQ